MGIFKNDNNKEENQSTFGLFSFMNEQSVTDDEDNDEVYENLDDWQKEEVKKGNQDPWDFEEEDNDDDSYYSDDD